GGDVHAVAEGAAVHADVSIDHRSGGLGIDGQVGAVDVEALERGSAFSVGADGGGCGGEAQAAVALEVRRGAAGEVEAGGGFDAAAVDDRPAVVVLAGGVAELERGAGRHDVVGDPALAEHAQRAFRDGGHS